MSDYSETFTKIDGNTVEASDFETEFQAIEAAIATKADVDSDTLTNLTIGSGFSGGAVVSGSATATTSGTEKEFGSIPAWVKKIIFSYNGVSSDGTSEFKLQLSDSGGYETTGYEGAYGIITGTNTCAIGTSSSGIQIGSLPTAAWTIYGSVTLSLIDSSTNTWVWSGTAHAYDGSSARRAYSLSGSKSLSGTLTALKLMSTAGDTLDAGKINILYEG